MNHLPEPDQPPSSLETREPAGPDRLVAAAHPRPTFLLAGAAKSGTTSLWAYLRQHPDVFLPEVKEPNYFAFGSQGPEAVGPAPSSVLQNKLYSRTVSSPVDYLGLFAAAGEAGAVGEASVRYLYYPEAPTRIAATLPDVRIVIVLRNPVDRLVSHFAMNRSLGLEPLELEQAVAAEDDRVSAGWGWDWHYVRVGRYAQQLRRYVNVFDPEQLLVLEYTQFRERPLETYAEVCRHIGVDPSFTPDMTRRIKEAYTPRHPRVDAALARMRRSPRLRRLVPSSPGHRAYQALRRANRGASSPLDARLRDRLAASFRAEATEVEALIGRPFPSLRTGPPGLRADG